MTELTFAHQHVQIIPDKLIEFALKRKEGVLCANQALAVNTGKRTGRSPKDRFIVRDALTEHTVNWDFINQPFPLEKFNQLWRRTADYLSGKELFVSRLKVGADPKYELPIILISETAWQCLFATQLFIRDKGVDTTRPNTWTIMSAPGFSTNPERDGVNSDGAVIMDFTQQRILVCGMQYAGEIKKAMFTVLNFILPDKDTLPMHCSANVGKDGDSALFFGLSGTGKTTLSADPERYLIGDDEHGWSSDGIFNFEGGCYAKCINLSQQREPLIWDAIRFGAIMENVIIDPVTLEPHYEDDSLTENTRVAYPREHINNRVEENRANHPKSVIFLSCDLYGVLPPVSILNLEQAAYYFLSGYTALVGSTEVGSSAGIKPTFSTCFGAPFFPRPPIVYAQLLQKRLQETRAPIYLINTGWTGGAYGQGGQRFDIPVTRAVVTAALGGHLINAPLEKIPGFGFSIPKEVPGVASKLLNPKNTWRNASDYEHQAKALMSQFIDNFRKFQDVPAAIQAAGPIIG
ncbi:MAG TPA: phosphoenolpyruvate carboxykinase (ATP) [Gammaproteobacteria bacterium]|nr:phosphoenolpyruvate carboxykinase (ATP) [Gammaproteobacteria bacterium]